MKEIMKLQPEITLSLRLCPAVVGNNDDDEDGNFAKWMSSYWGHGASEEQTKGRRRSLMQLGHLHADRRASLPCQAQLDRMRLHGLHDRSQRSRKEVSTRPRARCASSDDSHHRRAANCEKRISTIPELSESFERKPRLRARGVAVTNDVDNMCLIHQEDIRGGKSCAHQLHRESCKSGLAIFDWLMRKVKRSEHEAPCSDSGGPGETSGGARLGAEQEERRPSQLKLCPGCQR
ncbi:uncharacterized protein LOC125710352 [Brienomyrus brachyistius]|uniref:uncharacterized protein LOC125710352 n=1 Tax=Brienomyrus brachyistius TaxID=42636 RepID=UPI0020B1F51D|nr:uncharacterized protein LOC125710352 [Brienomyrus brachyistius]